MVTIINITDSNRDNYYSYNIFRNKKIIRAKEFLLSLQKVNQFSHGLFSVTKFTFFFNIHFGKSF